MKKNKLINLLVRIAISCFIIVILLLNIDIIEIKEAIAKTNYQVLIIGVAVYILGQIVGAYKWQLLASKAGFNNKIKEYVDYYFIGMFFNLFLPTTVGGDVSKAYYLAKHDTQNRKAPAVYSVLCERYSGVAIIVWTGTIALFSPLGKDIPMIFKVLMSSVTMLIFLITPTFPSFWMQFSKRKKWVRTMLKDVRFYWRNPRLIIKILYFSILYHLLILGIHCTIGAAMGLDINIGFYLIVYPMTAMAGFLPVAFNGIGPREWAYIYFLSFAGIKESDAMVFSVFWFGIVLISSLIGGIFYLKGKYIPPPEEFEIEQDIDYSIDDEDIQLESAN